MKPIPWNEYWVSYTPSKSEEYLIRERNKIIIQLLSDLGNPPQKLKILEAGCGFASNSKLLQKNGFSAFCLDTSRVIIKRIRNEVETALAADARYIPFKENSFDLVFSAGLIEHHKQPRGIISEMFRVARLGGVVLNFVPGSYSLWQVYRFMQRIRGGWMHGYEESYTLHKLKRSYPQRCTEILSGGIDFFSIKGFFIKTLGVDIFPDFKIGKDNYTEIYYAAKKDKLPHL